MRDISARPTDSGKRIDAPVRCTLFNLVVNDPDTDLDYHFALWTNDTTTPGTRYLIDVAYRVPGRADC